MEPHVVIDYLVIIYRDWDCDSFKKKKQASYIMALRNFEPFVIFVKYFLLKDI